MTAPRAVFPGQFLLITRRCAQQQFLLHPDEATNNAFVYCLGCAAKRYGIQIVLSVMESNHHHTVIYDPKGTQVEFREYFHRMMAKVQNARFGRWENVWASVEPSVVELADEGALLDALVYTATNPVKDNLVAKVSEWPGPDFINALMTGTILKATRPTHYFRADGDMPAAIEVTVALPEHVASKDEMLDELRRRIASEERAFASDRAKTGQRVLGRKRVLMQSWKDSPTNHAPRRVLNPRVAAKDMLMRILVLARNAEWRALYREARRNLIAKLPCVFPFGTYGLKRSAGVAVASLPAFS